MDPVPGPLLLRKSGSAGKRTLTSGSAARNSGHKTTEVVSLNKSEVNQQVVETIHRSLSGS
jgi:hypothetical protein